MKVKPALTMIELLVVVTFVGILAVPSYLAITQQRQRLVLETAEDELVATITRAHIFAREGRNDQAWGVVFVGERGYKLAGGTPLDWETVEDKEFNKQVRFKEVEGEIWFDIGTGYTADNKIIELVNSRGLEGGVEVNTLGVVEKL